MAKFLITGYIESIRYKGNSAEVYIGEVCKGWRDNKGNIVNDEYLMWRVLFPKATISYLTKFFDKGMLVDVYGVPKPYAKDHAGNVVDGYTILGKNIDRAAYQRNTVRKEIRAIKESFEHGSGTPDLQSYQEDDF